MSGQYNDVRGDFVYKLPRDQRTPAITRTRTGILLSFLPLNQRTVLYLFYFFDHTGLQTRYRMSLLMRIVSLKRMSTPAAAYPRMPADGRRKILTLDDRVDVLKRIDNG